MTETATLTLVGMALLAIVAAMVVLARKGKLSFKFKDIAGEIDMGKGASPAETGGGAEDGGAGAHVGDIKDVNVGEGAMVDGNINIGHVVGGNVGGDAGKTPRGPAADDEA